MIAMCNGILIQFGGKSRCIPLYPDTIPWHPPGPDPWEHLLVDIRTIATMNQWAAHVQNEGVRGELRQALQTALKTVSLKLPEGVTVGDGLLKATAGQAAGH
jgi:hypothetical protein